MTINRAVCLDLSSQSELWFARPGPDLFPLVRSASNHVLGHFPIPVPGIHPIAFRSLLKHRYKGCELSRRWSRGGKTERPRPMLSIASLSRECSLRRAVMIAGSQPNQFHLTARPTRRGKMSKLNVLLVTCFALDLASEPAAQSNLGLNDVDLKGD